MHATGVGGGRAPVRHETSLDRIGLALAAGGAIGGVVVTLLVMAGGRSEPLAMLAGLALGTLFSAIGLAAVAGPIWLAFHVGDMRRGHHAAMAGGLAGSLMFVGARSYGLGMAGLPVMADMLLTWLMLAGLAAGTASIMWRIAYRRVG